MTATDFELAEFARFERLGERLSGVEVPTCEKGTFGCSAEGNHQICETL